MIDRLPDPALDVGVSLASPATARLDRLGRYRGDKAVVSDLLHEYHAAHGLPVALLIDVPIGGALERGLI